MMMKSRTMMKPAIALLLVATAATAPTTKAATSGLTKLASFDGAEGTTFKWSDMNDPVMGGKSASSFEIVNKAGVFNGTCAIVPSLKAPGFCKISTKSGLFSHPKFADVSAHIDGFLELRVRSTTPSFAGFRAAFAAKDIPRVKDSHGGGSFKAHFNLTDSTDWQMVQVPFNTFSYDWSGFTGRCDTQDPGGQQHHCCSSADNQKYCPTKAFLSTITDIEVWAEGAEGDFHLEVDYIGANA